MVLIKAKDESGEDTKDKESDAALAAIAGGTQSFDTAKDKKGKSTKEVEEEQTRAEEYSYAQKYNQYKKVHRAFTKLQNLAPALEDLAENVEVIPSDKFVSGYTTKNNASLDKIRSKYDSNTLYNFLYNLNQDKGKERSHLTDNIDLTTTFDDEDEVNTRVLKPLTPPKKTVRQKDGTIKTSRPKRLPEINILLIEERYKELLEREYNVEEKTLTFLEVLEIIHINRFRTRPSSAKSNPKNRKSAKQSKSKRQSKFESMRQRLEEGKKTTDRKMFDAKETLFIKRLRSQILNVANTLSKHRNALGQEEETILDLVNKLESKISNPNIEKTILREARTLLTSRVEGETLDDRQQKIKEYQDLTTKPATISVAGKTTLPPTSPIPFDTETPSALIHRPNKRRKLIAKLKIKITKEILEEKAKLTELRQSIKDAKRLKGSFENAIEQVDTFNELVVKTGNTSLEIEQTEDRIKELKTNTFEGKDKEKEEEENEKQIKDLTKTIIQVKSEMKQFYKTKKEFEELGSLAQEIEKSMNTTRKEIFAEIDKLKEQGFDEVAESLVEAMAKEAEIKYLKTLGMPMRNKAKTTKDYIKEIVQDKKVLEMIKQVDEYILLVDKLNTQIEDAEKEVENFKNIVKGRKK